MINKIHFGKRITGYRKALKLSQAELSEKLGVTSQAVSKWECGIALPDLELLLALSHLYNVSINELLEGSDTFAKLTDRAYEYDGIAYFLPKEDKAINQSWADDIINSKWISRNWNDCFLKNNFTDTRAKIGNTIAGHGGKILEIGTGPGGGFMPYILRSNPDATIIINDLSPTVVREWKQFLDKELNSPNISYAVFNFCDIPFEDNSIDVVSDGGGIGNTEDGDKGKALKEVYRVLNPVDYSLPPQVLSQRKLSPNCPSRHRPFYLINVQTCLLTYTKRLYLQGSKKLTVKYVVSGIQTMMKAQLLISPVLLESIYSSQVMCGTA